MALTTRMELALTTSFRVHADQLRKGSGVPYLTHLLAVCSMVGEYGGDEDQMVAGLLHDSLEDRPDRVSIGEIIELFGWRVGHIVLGCSDCVSKPKPPWEPRKRAYLVRLRQESPAVKLVSAADKLHNTRALVRDQMATGDPMWSRFNATKEQQCWYLQACVEALGQEWKHPILRELEEEVGKLRRLCGCSLVGS